MVAFHGTLAWWRLTGGLNIKRDLGYWWHGAAGVDVFFVVSGFVMTVTTYGKEDQPGIARRFLERRAIRLLPMYWMMTVVFALEMLALRHFPAWNIAGESLSKRFFFGSLTLIPFQHNGNTDPLVAVGWTLSFELLFYLLFAIALRLRVQPLKFLAPVLLLLVAVGRFRGAHWPAFTLLASPLLLEFLAGMAIGVAIMRGFRMRTAWGLLLAAVGIGMMLIQRGEFVPHKALMWGVPAAMVVLGVSSIEETFGGAWPGWLLLLGDASYSLYLSHVLVLLTVSRGAEFFGLVRYGVERREDEVLFALTCLAIALPLSVVLYKMVERPMTDMLRRHLLGEDPPQSGRHSKHREVTAC